jgi:hypothetical protein
VTDAKTRAREIVAEIRRKVRAGEAMTQAEQGEFYAAIEASKDTTPVQLARLEALPRGWRQEHFRSILLPEWQPLQSTEDGASYESSDGLCVIVSADVELDGKRWLHVSCSRKDRLPSWNDLRRVKDLFIGMSRTAVQVLPRQEKYVNVHPRVLHLFTCLDDDPLPDFTRGTESL